MTKLEKKDVKNRKKIINSGKPQETWAWREGDVDENGRFHMLFRSYSQVIPRVWKTCDMYVEIRLIACGNVKKTVIIHIGGISEKNL